MTSEEDLVLDSKVSGQYEQGSDCTESQIQFVFVVALLHLEVSWEFSKIRRYPFAGRPIIRIVILEGLYWGPPYLEQLPKP